MRLRILLILHRLFVLTAIVHGVTFGLNAADNTTKPKFKAAANISINSNGIASIPAFSLDKPAVVATISLAKNRLSYEPVLGYGLDMKPWFIDNWVNYKIIDRSAFELRAGINFSTFFTPVRISDTAVLKAERYFAYTLTGIYKFTPASFLTLAYWSDNGQEKGTIRGHFINLMYEKNDFRLGNRGLLAIAMQLFYIDYTGNSDGFFFTPRVTASLREFPLSMLFMATQAIQSNIEPFPEFRWNVGLIYNF